MGGVWEVQGHMLVGRGAAGVVALVGVKVSNLVFVYEAFPAPPSPPRHPLTSAAVVLPLRKSFERQHNVKGK